MHFYQLLMNTASNPVALRLWDFRAPLPLLLKFQYFLWPKQYLIIPLFNKYYHNNNNNNKIFGNDIPHLTNNWLATYVVGNAKFFQAVCLVFNPMRLFNSDGAFLNTRKRTSKYYIYLMLILIMETKGSKQKNMWLKFI